ncbi:MAG: TraE/TraK family type IV conjugative transfer system protein, partial [Rhodospirillales bacterium]|nr:TraE/TraK family type IV conjugative transfer system protein [Rhodospirillales bacterium]
ARYLEDMARTVAVTLLTLTPENAGHVRLAAARMSHASARGAIGAWVEAEAARMAGRDMASAFYPTGIEADPERLSVEIAGELVTWIGREESSREDRRYRLAFRVDAGRIGLLRFEQMESAK